ncbi:MAG: hypothetical protein U9N85_10490, partial [Bacteroidota bacterium]|nr:hypothetical protein [Bacteroidota bacterium]
CPLTAFIKQELKITEKKTPVEINRVVNFFIEFEFDLYILFYLHKIKRIAYIKSYKNCFVS